jgi:hypothetical protein
MTDDFLSGTSGEVSGIRLTTRAIAADILDDAVAIAVLERWRVRRAARGLPQRKVLALAIERVGVPNVLADARAELARSHHDVHFASIDAGNRGKFQNLNVLLQENPAAGYDWLIVIDDDVTLPAGFLDSFLVLAERFDLALAQPAHRQRSHAAFQITRRRRCSLVRETAFVEIGPVFAFRADTFDVLLPFPDLRVGWGLDVHWSALARAHRWREGVVDATPIRHGLRRIAASYDRRDAVEEARRFLADRPYVPASQAQSTLATHRTWHAAPHGAGSEAYTPANLLDRMSARATLESHYRLMERRERQILSRRLGIDHGDVLSVGCGWHPGRHLFPSPAFRLVGVAGVLDTGRADEAHVGRAGALTFPAGSFDVVLYRLVLHHIAFRGPLRPCFEEAARLLRPGGALIAIEPGLWHPVGLGLALANRTGVATAIHGTPDDVPLSPRTLVAEARAAGLAPELHAVTYTWRRLPAPVQRLLAPLDAVGSRPRAACFGHTLMLIARRT